MVEGMSPPAPRLSLAQLAEMDSEEREQGLERVLPGDGAVAVAVAAFNSSI